ncbi:thiamine-phosphate kinase [Thiomicrorhabdus sp.]|uniref:thiamine-phosphate kinase n=1 Tax=Thiomicrorhabdus sp. TaxID=2039724 RepID=UPI0029C8065F|nr:thiamine-phosphate kinase [Thiomicrorhabdus sp.]
MAREFDLINDFFAPLGAPSGSELHNGREGQIGIGDDGAVISVPPGQQAVVVTDTLVAGVHFPLQTSPFDIGWKSLAVNLSDLAAMGAQPAFYSLALTLPTYDAEWLSEFAKGLKAASESRCRERIPLIGGDTTKGPLCITVSAQGWVPNGQAIMRHAARKGDRIFVTGTLGDAALGLKLAMPEFWGDFTPLSFSDEDRAKLLEALNRPKPQLAYSDFLREYASSAIDISDGLLADLGHILERSSMRFGYDLKACIDLAELPKSQAMQMYLQQTRDWRAILSGGDDYQICFTVSVDKLESMREAARKYDLEVYEVGSIELRMEGDGQLELMKHGQIDFAVMQSLAMKGFQHF